MNRIRPCWARIGTRPAVPAQLIREYLSLRRGRPQGRHLRLSDHAVRIQHASRSSSTCWRAGLIAKTSCWFSTVRPTSAAATFVPDNVMLLYLPPYSPELNPKENLWDEIREKISKTTH